MLMELHSELKLFSRSEISRVSLSESDNLGRNHNRLLQALVQKTSVCWTQFATSRNTAVIHFPSSTISFQYSSSSYT